MSVSDRRKAAGEAVALPAVHAVAPAAGGPAPAPGERAAGGAPAPLWRRLALLALAIALVVGLGSTVWLPAAHRSFDYHTRTHGWNWDFRVYYAAGRDWSLGIDPYSDQWLPVTTARVGEFPIRFAHQRTLRFIYPPTLLPLYRALAVLPYRTARVLWLGLNAAALAAAAVIALALERGRRLEVGAALLLLGLVSYPLLYHIREGNIDMIVAGLGTSAFLLYGRWRSWPTALLLALAIVTKVTPLLILAALVVYHRDLWLLAKSCAALAVLVGVSLLVMPLRFYDEAAQVLFLRSRGMPTFVNQSAMRLLFHEHTAARLVAAAAVAALLVWLFVLGRRAAAGRRAGAPPGRPPAPDVRLFLVVVLVMLLFSPIAWVWTYVWAIVPGAMLLAGRWRLRGAVAWLWLAVSLALMSAPLAHHGVLDSVTMLGGAVGLAGLLAGYAGVIDVAARPAAPGPVASPGLPSAELRRAA